MKMSVLPKCADCGREIHLQFFSEEPLYCRKCWRKRSPNIPNMKIVQRGHPHRTYGVEGETWPWVRF